MHRRFGVAVLDDFCLLRGWLRGLGLRHCGLCGLCGLRAFRLRRGRRRVEVANLLGGVEPADARGVEGADALGDAAGGHHLGGVGLPRVPPGETRRLGAFDVPRHLDFACLRVFEPQRAALRRAFLPADAAAGRLEAGEHGLRLEGRLAVDDVVLHRRLDGRDAVRLGDAHQREGGGFGLDAEQAGVAHRLRHHSYLFEGYHYFVCHFYSPC